MLYILLVILKIIGIVLAVLLCILITMLLLVLFVPIRYRIKADGKLGADEPLHAEIKITWLLHILNIRFSYPKEAYIRVRLFLFTIFNSSKPRKEKVPTKKDSTKETSLKKNIAKNEENLSEDLLVVHDENELEVSENLEEDADETSKEESIEKKPEKIWDKLVDFWEMLKKILRRFTHGIKNIEYTIKSICDKIKKIIKDIEYYTDILQSELFKTTFASSKKQLFRVFKSIRPYKWNMNLKAGTGDPASTGKLLAIYGILYPFIGNNIRLESDFEKMTAEGNLYIKGKVLLITILLAAWKIYWDKNIRKLIKMLTREES